MRLIDADAFVKDILTAGIGKTIIEYSESDIGYMIHKRPTADAAPVKHGRWVKLDMHKGMEQFKCSECSSECYVPTCLGTPMFDFCPNCGAKMDAED